MAVMPLGSPVEWGYDPATGEILLRVRQRYDPATDGDDPVRWTSPREAVVRLLPVDVKVTDLPPPAP